MWATRRSLQYSTAALSGIAGVSTSLTPDGQHRRYPPWRSHTFSMCETNRSQPPRPEDLKLPEALSKLNYKRQYTGQLTPPRPNDAELKEGATAAGRVQACGSTMSLQQGPYRSLWLRVLPEAKTAQFRALADRALDAHRSTAEKHELGAAFYLAISETSEAVPDAIQWSRQSGFKFHHYHRDEDASPDSKAVGEFVYYRWCGPEGSKDMVPHYSSSIEGAGAFILSPDEKDVLLVWEYGCWKMVTGAVDPGETSIDAARRECAEEVGVAIDSSFQPLFVGGAQLANARDRCKNDEFSTFAFRALSRDIHVDGKEIRIARWFPIQKVLSCAGDFSAPWRRVQGKLEGTDDVELNSTMLMGLRALAEGHVTPVQEEINEGSPRAWWYGGAEKSGSQSRR